MPRGPKDEKRPADVIATAHKVFQIATGEVTDNVPSGRHRSGLAGAAAKAKVLSSSDRKDIAKKAPFIRWKKDHNKGAK